MSAGFGWSIGDIVLLAKTIRQVRDALDQDSGAASEYQKVTRSLQNLQITLQEVHAILSKAEPVFRNAIRGQLDQSTSSISDFNKKLERKYGHALGVNSPKEKFRGVWRKLGWAFGAAKDLADFRLQLTDQLNAVKFLIISDIWQTSITSSGQVSANHAVLLDLLTVSTSNSAEISSTLHELRSTLAPCMYAIKDLSDLSKNLSTEIQQTFHTRTHDLDTRLINIENHVEKNTFQTQEALEVNQVDRGTVEYHLNAIMETQMSPAKTQDSLVKSISELRNMIQEMHAQDNRRIIRSTAEHAEQFLRIRQRVDETKSMLVASQKVVPVDTATSMSPQDIIISTLRHTRTGVEIAIKNIHHLLALLRHCIIHLLRVYPYLLLFFNLLRMMSPKILQMSAENTIYLEDFLGNRRLLDGTYFQYFQVFNTFIRSDYMHRPGGNKVLKNEFTIRPANEPHTPVTAQNWKSVVSEGKKLIMSAVITNIPNLDYRHCPTCDRPFPICSSEVPQFLNAWCKHCSQNYYFHNLGDQYDDFEAGLENENIEQEAGKRFDARHYQDRSTLSFRSKRIEEQRIFKNIWARFSTPKPSAAASTSLLPALHQVSVVPLVEYVWYCGWCPTGPMRVDIDELCFGCIRHRDLYAKYEISHTEGSAEQDTKKSAKPQDDVEVIVPEETETKIKDREIKKRSQQTQIIEGEERGRRNVNKLLSMQMEDINKNGYSTDIWTCCSCPVMNLTANLERCPICSHDRCGSCGAGRPGL